MKSVFKLILATALLVTASGANAQQKTGSQVMLYSLLTGKDVGLSILATKTIARDPITHASAMDMVATLLAEKVAHPVINGKELDSVAWLMKALGASHKSRYKRLVEQAISAYNHEKITAHGNLVLAELNIAGEETFVADMASLDLVRQKLAEDRLSIKASSGNFSDLKPDHSLDVVIRVMGYPDEIVETVESRGHLVNVHLHSLQLRYYGRGLVDIDNEFAAKLGWRASDVWPDVENSLPPYADERAIDAALVMTSHPMVLLKLSVRLVRGRVIEAAVLERVAERIRISARTTNEFEANALSYFCALLGNSGDRRYASALEFAIREAKVGRLRRHAKESLKQLGLQ